VSIERRTCKSSDGVTIVYSAAGAGDTALIFVHGGLAIRGFFDDQLRGLADRYRVIAVDLAGHGESGADRRTWGIPRFGGDVKAVAEAERLERNVVLGNSLGGAVAVEAAILLPDRVIGVVGIDTFQRIDHTITAAEARQRAEALQSVYEESVDRMVKQLFHADAPEALVRRAREQMLATPEDVAGAMFLSMAGYRLATSFRRTSSPSGGSSRISASCS
jgi:pimeloyl-ACP methyl ester carboxylesterase